MNKHVPLLFVFSILSLAFFLEVFSNRSKPPTGRAGDPPASRTCVNGCHQGTDLNAGPGEVEIVSNIPELGYEPNATYTISLKVKEDSIARFGFETIPFSTNLSRATGSITITDPTRTQLLGNIAGDREYVTHTSAGTESVDSSLWSFDWTAPEAGIGEVVFYGAFVSANRNNRNTGDRVYSTQLAVKEAGAASISQIQGVRSMRAYQDQPSSYIILEWENLETANMEVRILELSGKEVFQTISQASTGRDRVSVPGENLPHGIYLAQFRTNRGTAFRKFMLQ